MNRAWFALLCAVAGCVASENSAVQNTLVRIDEEPAGSNCEHGGLAIQTGRDKNRNGVVEDSEISSTYYVCSGERETPCSDPGSVTGVVVVQDPTDFAQLDGVKCLDGDLIIAGYPDAALPDLSLEEVTGSITVAGNATLTSLSGFGKLTAVRTYALQGNDALVDLTTIGQLTRIGALIISGNDSLKNLAGLASWTELGPNLTVNNNNSLESLDGLQNVLIALQSIRIRANRQLSSVAALNALKIVGLVDISGNSLLPSITLAGLQKVNVTASFNSNAALTSVSLPELATASEISVSSNPVLETVHLDGLAVTNGLALAANPMLTTLSAPNLAAVTERLDLRSLPSLTTLDLTGLQAVGNLLHLQQLPALMTLSGLSQLRKVTGDMTVHTCGELTSFTGLSSLEQIAGTLLVQSNAKLTSFTGVQGTLDTIGGNLSILSNPMLQLSDAQAFAASVTVTGTTTIN